jgi:hypothetical protein
MKTIVFELVTAGNDPVSAATVDVHERFTAEHIAGMLEAYFSINPAKYQLCMSGCMLPSMSGHQICASRNSTIVVRPRYGTTRFRLCIQYLVSLTGTPRAETRQPILVEVRTSTVLQHIVHIDPHWTKAEVAQEMKAVLGIDVDMYYFRNHLGQLIPRTGLLVGPILPCPSKLLIPPPEHILCLTPRK